MMKQKTAFIFPGQGSQFIGMGKDLYEKFPEAKAVFQEVDETLHQNLSGLMFDGDIKELTQTQNAQPAIMAVSMAGVRVLEAKGFSFLKNVSFVAGHSLGEYTALCSCGVLTLSQTAHILKIRGQAMAAAGQKEPGGMLAVLGLDPDSVQKIADDSGCYVANDNGGGQWVLSGSLVTLSTAKMRAESLGAKRVIPLPVAGAFHSPLMQSAQEPLKIAFQKMVFQTPTVPVVENVSAKAESNNFADLLTRQIVSPVRWRESILYMQTQGVTRFVECGPGTVLSGLVRRIFPESQQIHVNDSETISAFLKTQEKNT